VRREALRFYMTHVLGPAAQFTSAASPTPACTWMFTLGFTATAVWQAARGASSDQCACCLVPFAFPQAPALTPQLSSPMHHQLCWPQH